MVLFLMMPVGDVRYYIPNEFLFKEKLFPQIGIENRKVIRDIFLKISILKHFKNSGK